MILLKIGYQSFAVKSNKEAFAVMQTLSKSVEVTDRRYDKRRMQINDRQPEIQMEVLPEGTKFFREDDEETDVPTAKVLRLNPPTLRLMQ